MQEQKRLCYGAGRILTEYMANSEYKTVKANAESEIEIRKSVFIASVSRSETADEADDFVREIKKRFPEANHTCYA